LADKAAALARIASGLNENFDRAVQLILDSDRHVVVTGVGKSGLIGKKIAATLASTGTPSFFMHPVEAYHGDLGMLTGGEVVLLLSYSGRTEEVVRLLPVLKRLGVKTIAMVGVLDSPVALAADVVLHVDIKRETCPHNLAPTTSAVGTLALGDALAVVLMQERRFSAADFASLHPGGSLGRRLLGAVSDVMRRGPVPMVTTETVLGAAAVEISAGRSGLALVADKGDIVGHISVAHIKKALAENSLDAPVSAYMGPPLTTVSEQTSIAEAEGTLRGQPGAFLGVVDDDDKLIGLFGLDD